MIDLPDGVGERIEALEAAASSPDDAPKRRGRPPGSRTDPEKLERQRRIRAAIDGRDADAELGPDWTPERVRDVIGLPCKALAEMLGASEPDPDDVAKLARGIAPAIEKHKGRASVEAVAFLSVLAFVGPMLRAWMLQRAAGKRGASLLSEPRTADSWEEV